MTTQIEFDVPAEHESDILRAATLWLAERNVFEWRNNTGVASDPRSGRHVRFGIPGGSDLLVIVPPFGRFLGVETKAKRGRQSDKQKRFEAAVRRAGGVYALVKTLDELRVAFDETSTLPNSVREEFALIAENHARRLDEGDQYIKAAHRIADAIRAGAFIQRPGRT